MAAASFDFEELLVYQKALDFVAVVYKATKRLPADERFGLSSQFQRAATGICLNIAEGSGGTKTEFRHYVRIAVRSVRECVAIAEVATKVDYFNRKQREYLRGHLAELARMLTGLHKSLSARKRKENG